MHPLFAFPQPFKHVLRAQINWQLFNAIRSQKQKIPAEVFPSASMKVLSTIERKERKPQPKPTALDDYISDCNQFIKGEVVQSVRDSQMVKLMT